MSAQNTNHLTAEIYHLEDSIKDFHLESARNEARWKAENQELRVEIDDLIMSNAVADAEIERLNGLLVKIANIVNRAHFTTEELGNAD